MTILGLALSTIVAATVVSVGIARANVVGNVIDNEGSLFTVALLLGLIFIAVTLFLPQGVIGAAGQLRSKWRERLPAGLRGRPA